MIGDIIELEERHLAPAREIIAKLKESFSFGSKPKIAIGIAGESGSGKSVTAFALQKVLEEEQVKSVIIQMDDYFKLPPRTNHENRLKSLENVGIHEVDLEKLAQNMSAFKNEAAEIEKPLVSYNENTIGTEKFDASEYDVVIVEGTYILELNGFDFKIFIDRNYKDTYENRMKRNRDEQSDFVEKVLEIEHQIIRNFKNNADLILGKNYELVNPTL
ncbi:uridine kinase [Chryseobacterium sp. SORGH_AS 447]|uniref:uridine kinase family protein n=1 Tax=Chryseobacterium sp. SORGH_AS_0447 TaxID=3041769 RepID=UPI002788EE62|nr:zeta toxin family protein [Chryseobacterium sp. SORGH_AS_0447]MDQ1161789.1 uridine kinase [Chryseobacterium sp. SORGH_AS_0447]